MRAGSMEILCTACGQDALLRREPVYEGFKKTGEVFMCAACGHRYASEEDVPFKSRKQVSIFTDDDKSTRPDIFQDDERQKNCRYCVHYTVNPFTQRCGLHNRIVDATDWCPDFERRKDEAEADDADNAGSTP